MDDLTGTASENISSQVRPAKFLNRAPNRAMDLWFITVKLKKFGTIPFPPKVRVPPRYLFTAWFKGVYNVGAQKQRQQHSRSTAYKQNKK